MSNTKSKLGLIEVCKLALENKIPVPEFEAIIKSSEEETLNKLKSAQSVKPAKPEDQTLLDSALDTLKTILKAIDYAKKFVKEKAPGHLETALSLFSNAREKALKIKEGNSETNNSPVSQVVSDVTSMAVSDNISIKLGNLNSFSFEKSISFTPKPKKRP